jgi:hypothetical protein
LVWDLESASLEDMAGDGTTGDLIGITTMSVSTTTTTSPTAEFSPIATISITAADFMVAALQADEVSARRSMASRHHTPSQVHIPAHSAALIMEELPEAFPHAGSRASVEATEVEASMEVAVSMEAEAVTEGVAVTGKRRSLLQTQLMTWRRNHAH